MKPETGNKKKAGIGILAKFTLIFLALILLLLIGTAFFAYRIGYNGVKSEYSALASESAAMAASLVDGDRIAGWLKNGPDQAYYDAEATLKDLKKNYGLKFLYIFVPYTDENNAAYIFDIAVDGEDEPLLYALGDESGAFDVYGTVLEAYTTGKGVQPGVITKSEFGHLASAYEPLFSALEPDRAVACAGADIEVSGALKRVREGTLQIAGAAAGIALLFMVLILYAMRRKIVKPVRALSAHMQNFVSGGRLLTGARMTDIRARDEIGRMAGSFNGMADDIAAYAENLARAAANEARVAAERSAAAEIQSGILPRLPACPDRDDLNIFAIMHPAKEAGGDFYDFFPIDRGRLCVVIADVSRKGIPAARFMLTAHTLIKDRALLGKEPQEVFTFVNNLLCENNCAGISMTAFMGVLDLATGRFVYTNAGHNPPILKGEGGRFEWLDAEAGPALAGMENTAYSQNELTLHAGDTLFLYTDGVTGALDGHEERYGGERLIKTLNKRPDCMPKDLLSFVRRDIAAFSGKAEQKNDITMLGLTYLGKSEKADGGEAPALRGLQENDCGAAELTVPASIDSLEGILWFVGELPGMEACPMNVRIALNIAIEAAFTDIAARAPDGTVTVRCAVREDPGRIVITFVGDGKEYNPLLRGDPDSTASKEERADGPGISMVKESMDGMCYEYADGVNMLIIEKRLF